jgi:hypothetical protein
MDQISKFARLRCLAQCFRFRIPCKAVRYGVFVNLERTVTAPQVQSGHVPSHISYCCWFLEEHPEMLEGFIQFADDFHRRNPTVIFGAPLILSAMRYAASRDFHASDDTFRVNNNIGSLLVRLYRQERPGVAKVLDIRKSWLDSLNTTEQAQLDDALARGRTKLEARDGLR